VRGKRFKLRAKKLFQENWHMASVWINGRVQEVESEYVTYDQLVKMVNGSVSILYTITFGNGRGRKISGTVVPGERVKVRPGMTFSAVGTGRNRGEEHVAV